MAKRFTDSEKWKHPWFRKLPPNAKLVWFYLLDACDHAGVWMADFELMSFQLGIDVSKEQFDAWFDSKVDQLEDDKYFVRSFVEFQYGKLKADNRAHKSVIQTLEKLSPLLAPSKPLASPYQGAKDKDKDKDKEKDKVKDKEQDKDTEPLASDDEARLIAETIKARIREMGGNLVSMPTGFSA